MIVERRLSETGQQIENLTLTASTSEDYALLAALYRDYSRGGVEITLRDGERLRSVRTEKRRSPRVSIRLPVRILWKEGEQEHRERTFTVNLSRFGCAIHSHKFFQPKTPVRLQYEDKTMEAETVYSVLDHSQKLSEVGVGFHNDGRDFWELAGQRE